MQKKEIIPLVIASIVTLVGGYLFFKDDLPRLGRPLGPPIAIIKKQSKVVKRKESGSIGWQDANSGQNLYNQDQIYTHDASFAEIKFKDDSQINVSPNTLLRIGEGPNGIDLNLLKGFMSLSLQNQRYRLRYGDKVVVLNGENAKIQVMNVDGGQKLTLMEGSLSMKVGNQTIKLKQGESVNYKNGQLKILKSDIAAATPHSEKVVYLDPRGRVNLDWKSKKKFKKYKVEISRDPYFKRSRKFKVTKKTSEVFGNLEEGKHFWKVKVFKNNEWFEGPIYTFNVKKDQPPYIIYPGLGTYISINDLKRGRSMEFQWEDQDAESYEVEIREKGKKKKKYLTTGPRLDLNNLKLTRYYWRLRVKDPIRPRSPWSNFYTFKVIDPKLAKRPSPIYPKHRSEIDHTNILRPITFKWTGESEGRYEIVIAKDPQFQDLYVFKKVVGNRFTWNQYYGGKFYWKVRDVHLPMKNLKAYFFRILGHDAMAMVPKGIGNSPLKFKGDQVPFIWKFEGVPKNIKDDFFLLEVAKDKKITNIIHKATYKQNQASVSLPDHGTYYWRIRQVRPRKKEKTKWDESGIYSKISSFTIGHIGALPSPKIRRDYYKEVSLNSDDRAGAKYYSITENRPIKDFSVELNWKKVQYAKHYQLNVFRGPNDRRPIFSTKVDGNSARWDLNDLGIYYYQVISYNDWGIPSQNNRLGKLTIAPNEKMRGPTQLVSPDHKKVIEFPDRNLLFSWQAKNYLKHYTIQFAQDESFNSIEGEWKVSDNKILKPAAKIMPPGQYYWRVKTHFLGNHSYTSDTRTVVILSNEQRIHLANQKKKDDEKRENQRLEEYRKNSDLADKPKDWFDYIGLNLYPLISNVTISSKNNSVISGTFSTSTYSSILAKGLKILPNQFFINNMLHWHDSNVNGQAFYKELSNQAVLGHKIFQSYFFLISGGAGVRIGKYDITGINDTNTALTLESIVSFIPVVYAHIDIGQNRKYSHFLESSVGFGASSFYTLKYLLKIKTMRKWHINVGTKLTTQSLSSGNTDYNIVRQGYILGMDRSF